MIVKHVKLVDDTPHAALLYGGDPDNDRRPALIKGFMKSLPSTENTSLQFWKKMTILCHLNSVRSMKQS